MWIPEAMWLSMVRAAPDCKEEGSFFCRVLMTLQTHSRDERPKRPLGQLPPSPKRKLSRQEAIEEILQIL